jgi:hypothetical protein
MGGEPMNLGDRIDVAPADGQATGQGVCSICGEPLPDPDLEGVAADVDHRLSLEFGQLVARSAWAGRAPDGLLDGLLGFMPGVRAKKSIWQRGQTLWTELMTAALTGPCERCRASSEEPGGQALTMMQPAASLPEPQGTRVLGPDSAVPPGPGGVLPGLPTSAFPTPGRSSSADGGFDLPTRAMPASEPLSASSGPTDSPTMAMPEPPPAWLPDRSQDRPQDASPETSKPDTVDAEEYEAHTVMIPAMSQISAGPVLVVLEGPVHGHEFSVDRTTTTIGRSIGCHVTITADQVGYEHARVIRSEGRYRLEVTAGAGGTLVNDERVTTPRPLQSGDIIQIGPARFRFEAAS